MDWGLVGVAVGEPGSILRGKRVETWGETAACLEKVSDCLVLTLGMAKSLWPPVSVLFTSHPPGDPLGTCQVTAQNRGDRVGKLSPSEC